MIKIGVVVGALNTVFLIFLTAIIGVYLARFEGIKTLRNGIKNVYLNKTPIYEIVSGASIAFAALLLIIPGFLTDSVGFLLVIPLTRKILIKRIFKKKEPSMTKENSKILDGEIIEDKEKDEL